MLPWQIPTVDMHSRHSLRGAGRAGGRTWGSGAGACHQVASVLAEVLAESEGNAGWVVGAGGDQLQLLSISLTFLLKFLQRKKPVRLLEAWFPEGVKILHNADPRVLGVHVLIHHQGPCSGPRHTSPQPPGAMTAIGAWKPPPSSSHPVPNPSPPSSHPSTPPPPSSHSPNLMPPKGVASFRPVPPARGSPHLMPA